MTLKEQILAEKKAITQKVGEERVNVFLDAIDEMVKQKLAKDAIKVGNSLKDGTLYNVEGKEEKLSSIIDKPTVIALYRGSWCPYCNLELRAHQNILPEIKEKGAKLIAISPEKPDSSLSFKEKMELEFGVYSDNNNDYTRTLGLTFKLDDKMANEHKKMGFDLEEFNGISTNELPFGATLVVDENCKVIYAFVTEDYTKRAEPADILKELDKLKG